jgi:hypothetical protein
MEPSEFFLLPPDVAAYPASETVWSFHPQTMDNAQKCNRDHSRKYVQNITLPITKLKVLLKGK